MAVASAVVLTVIVLSTVMVPEAVITVDTVVATVTMAGGVVRCVPLIAGVIPLRITAVTTINNAKFVVGSRDGVGRSRF